MERYLKKNAPRLGFGLMRLPKKDGHIDIEQTKQMVDLFMAAGQTYFDTAYVYDGGESEKAAGEALVARYPRDSYTLATKLNVRADEATAESARRQLFTSLERTGAGYFDFYLLHALQTNNYQLYEQMGLWEFLREQKAKGLVRHWGFSFHATPELLDELLTVHPDAEFVQLQINYADWENEKVASRANYEVARRHGKPVVIMEPVKGGALAQPIPPVQNIFKAADPNASFASWAIRYAASLEGVLAVLSGMSNLDQMTDNLSYMKEFRPLDPQERIAIQKAQEAINGVKSIPCTACHYCTAGCPMQIPIPEIFAARNLQTIWGQLEEGARQYAALTREASPASACIACGQCETVCPQQIDVIERLRGCAGAFGR